LSKWILAVTTSGAYEQLVKTGAIGSLKRDIMIESSQDLYYLWAIRHWFTEASAEASKNASACALRVVRELTSNGMCRLATWGTKEGTFDDVSMSDDDLIAHFERYTSSDHNPFDIFLLTTDVGNEWVRKYEQLVADL
jgi:hypothetical protein